MDKPVRRHFKMPNWIINRVPQRKLMQSTYVSWQDNCPNVIIFLSRYLPGRPPRADLPAVSCSAIQRNL